MWATVLKSEGRYVGRCGLYPHLSDGARMAGEAVLGFYIAREFWGRGLATEAARAFVDFGFERIETDADCYLGSSRKRGFDPGT